MYFENVVLRLVSLLQYEFIQSFSLVCKFRKLIVLFCEDISCFTIQALVGIRMCCRHYFDFWQSSQCKCIVVSLCMQHLYTSCSSVYDTFHASDLDPRLRVTWYISLHRVRACTIWVCMQSYANVKNSDIIISRWIYVGYVYSYLPVYKSGIRRVAASFREDRSWPVAC